jgi:hypothetical protein
VIVTTDLTINAFAHLTMCCDQKYEAQLIFDTMKRAGVKPSAVTYGAYASALAEANANQQQGNNDEPIETQDAFAGCGVLSSRRRSSAATPLTSPLPLPHHDPFSEPNVELEVICLQ